MLVFGLLSFDSLSGQVDSIKGQDVHLVSLTVRRVHLLLLLSIGHGWQGRTYPRGFGRLTVKTLTIYTIRRNAHVCIVCRGSSVQGSKCIMEGNGTPSHDASNGVLCDKLAKRSKRPATIAFCDRMKFEIAKKRSTIFQI